jgi:hypothetical protein
MWRFLLPALAMPAALMVLFAGGTEPRHAPPPATPAPPVASAEQQAAQAALQRQIADLQRQAGDLQNQIEQWSHDIEARRAEADELRQGFEAIRTETDALRQQRQVEEHAPARDKAQAQQIAAANAPRRPSAPKRAARPLAPPATGPSAAQQLRNAQQWLTAGRPAEARQILAMAQAQMAEGGNPSATDIGTAVRWLDMGAYSQAMQAISRAINHAKTAESPPRPWSSYPYQSLHGEYGNDGS